jgi:hypothetical protein
MNKNNSFAAQAIAIATILAGCAQSASIPPSRTVDNVEQALINRFTTASHTESVQYPLVRSAVIVDGGTREGLDRAMAELSIAGRPFDLQALTQTGAKVQQVFVVPLRSVSPCAVYPAANGGTEICRKASGNVTVRGRIDPTQIWEADLMIPPYLVKEAPASYVGPVVRDRIAIVSQLLVQPESH